MAVQHTFIVQEAGIRPCIRLDSFLADMLRDSGFSREKIKRLIREGKCLVGGKAEYSPKTTLTVGELVVIQVEIPPTALNAEPGDLDILYRDAALAVVNKPAGLTVHPAPGRPTGTLAHRLLSHFPELKAQEGFRPGIVHRLDKDTSGLMLVALTEQCRLILTGQFARHEVYKEYLALVRGVPAREEESIEAPIGRHPMLKTKMAVMGGGKPAKSARRTLFADPRGRFSLQAVRTFSGRTHQVRVHMQHIGHPLLGDLLYGGSSALGPCRAKRPAKRQMLHAWKLSFAHPLPTAEDTDSASACRQTRKAQLWAMGLDSSGPAPEHKASLTKDHGKLRHYCCPPPPDFVDTVRACLSRSLPVVITGSPGCGKSLLLDFFRERGFPVFSADAEVARLYQPGGDGTRLLRARFGDRFVPTSDVGASDAVDKAALGAAMREDNVLRREIEALLHPPVWHATATFWKTHEDRAVLSIAEIPLYLESDHKPGCESGPLLVGVSCPFAIREERLKQSRGWNEAIIAGMEAWQWPEDKKMRACDLIIDNSEDLPAFNRNAEALLSALLEMRRERLEAVVRHVQSFW